MARRRAVVIRGSGSGHRGLRVADVSIMPRIPDAGMTARR